MKTLRELYEAVKALLPGSQGFLIGIDVWDYRGNGDLDIEYRIWSVEQNKHYKGRTPDAALLRLREALAPPTVPSALDAIPLPVEVR